MQKPTQQSKIKIQLHVTRHGQTEHNKKRIACGQNPGKLTQKGIQQAQKLGAHFKNKQFDMIYVSDLGRTKQTFQNMCKSAPNLKQMKTQYLSVLRQRSIGKLADKPLKLWDQLAKNSKLDVREFRCEGGQSWMDVNARVHKFLQYLITQNIIKKNIKKQETLNTEKALKVLVVCHGGYIMQFHNACRQISQKVKQKFKLDNSASNCSVHVFELGYSQELKQYKQQELDIKCTLRNYSDHMK